MVFFPFSKARLENSEITEIFGEKLLKRFKINAGLSFPNQPKEPNSEKYAFLGKFLKIS